MYRITISDRHKEIYIYKNFPSDDQIMREHYKYTNMWTRLDDVIKWCMTHKRHYYMKKMFEDSTNESSQTE